MPFPQQRLDLDLKNALAAEAGINDLGALLEAETVPCVTEREHRLHLDHAASTPRKELCTP